MSTELIIATFAGDEAKASEALAAVKKLHKDGSLKLISMPPPLLKPKTAKLRKKMFTMSTRNTGQFLVPSPADSLDCLPGR